MQPARLPLQGDAVSTGVIDSKRSHDQTLNSRNGFVGFSRDFVFGLIALLSGQDCRCNWDRSTRDPKMKAREHAGAAIQI